MLAIARLSVKDSQTQAIELLNSSDRPHTNIGLDVRLRL